MPQTDIETLNRAIADAGANWVAVQTPYSRLDGETATSAAMGLALTPEAAYDDLRSARSIEFNMMVAAPPPPAIDWRAYNGANWVTPIRDQATCGSCVAFATVATMESRTLIAQNVPGVDFDLSEAHLFYCGVSNACGQGWQPPLALAQAQAVGIGREASFPYTPRNQPCPMGVPVVANAGNAVTAATTLARKQALLDGPVIACFAVYGDFFHYGSGVYRHVTGNLAGYHAVCVVGYDDANACWIAKNSWNTSWGEQGFFRIRYGECGIDSQYPFYYPDSVTLVPGTTIP